MTITGDSFGTDIGEIVVTIVSYGGSNSPCAPYLFITPHTEFLCSLAPGAGANLPVQVTVNGVAGITAANAKFSYAPPSITLVNTASVINGKVTILGDNFGISSILVTIGTVACGAFDVDSFTQFTNAASLRYRQHVCNCAFLNCTYKKPK